MVEDDVREPPRRERAREDRARGRDVVVVSVVVVGRWWRPPRGRRGAAPSRGRGRRPGAGVAVIDEAAVGTVQRGRVDAVDDDRARRAQLRERRARLKPRQLTNF